MREFMRAGTAAAVSESNLDTIRAGLTSLKLAFPGRGTPKALNIRIGRMLREKSFYLSRVAADRPRAPGTHFARLQFELKSVNPLSL